jgi:DNA-binding transcriptional MerR regulator
MPGPPEIPNRSLFRQAEVCEIAQVQPYVLRSWESEFPELGVSKGTTRVYRRSDVELVLRLKHLVFAEGLTLAGARRRLDDERPAQSAGPTNFDELFGTDARERIQQVKAGLRGILQLLKAPAGAPLPFRLEAPDSKDGKHVKPGASRRSERASMKPARPSSRGR